MQIKKYEAVDMPSAIRMIKSELGSDAVILSTRSIHKGKGAFGLFGRPMVEVTAAVDPDSGKAKTSSFDNALAATTSKPRRHDLPAWVHPLKHELQEIKEGMEALKSATNGTQDMSRLFDELSSVKLALHASMESDPGQQTRKSAAPLERMKRRLIANDVDPKIASKLLSGIERSLPAEVYATDRKMDATLRRVLQNVLRVQNGIRLDGEGPKKVAFVGPTGVGKTTTIAKIASHYSLNEKKKVALVTIDTYRIAAIEQLKIYAKIIGIPMDVVVHEEDLDRVFKKHRDKDLILIDTAGRSHLDLEQMKELRRMLAARQDIERHLVLSTTTKQADLSSIIKNFRSIGFHYLLFTKIDEGSRLGTIFSAVLEAGKFVSYLTHGQRVPEDIREARVEELVELILTVESGRRLAS